MGRNHRERTVCTCLLQPAAVTKRNLKTTFAAFHSSLCHKPQASIAGRYSNTPQLGLASVNDHPGEISSTIPDMEGNRMSYSLRSKSTSEATATPPPGSQPQHSAANPSTTGTIITGEDRLAAFEIPSSEEDCVETQQVDNPTNSVVRRGPGRPRKSTSRGRVGRPRKITLSASSPAPAKEVSAEYAASRRNSQHNQHSRHYVPWQQPPMPRVRRPHRFQELKARELETADWKPKQKAYTLWWNGCFGQYEVSFDGSLGEEGSGAGRGMTLNICCVAKEDENIAHEARRTYWAGWFDFNTVKGALRIARRREDVQRFASKHRRLERQEAMESDRHGGENQDRPSSVGGSEESDDEEAGGEESGRETEQPSAKTGDKRKGTAIGGSHRRKHPRTEGGTSDSDASSDSDGDSSIGSLGNAADYAGTNNGGSSVNAPIIVPDDNSDDAVEDETGAPESLVDNSGNDNNDDGTETVDPTEEHSDADNASGGPLDVNQNNDEADDIEIADDPEENTNDDDDDNIDPDLCKRYDRLNRLQFVYRCIQEGGPNGPVIHPTPRFGFLEFDLEDEYYTSFVGFIDLPMFDKNQATIFRGRKLGPPRGHAPGWSEFASELADLRRRPYKGRVSCKCCVHKARRGEEEQEDERGDEGEESGEDD